MVAHLNGTLLASIPRVDESVFMKQFRPISLCDVSYRLSNFYLRSVMQDLASPCQCIALYPTNKVVIPIYHCDCSRSGSLHESWDMEVRLNGDQD